MQRIISSLFILLMTFSATADETIDYETGAKWLGGEYLQHQLIDIAVSAPNGAIFVEGNKIVWVDLNDPTQPQRLDVLVMPDRIIDIDSAGDLVVVAIEDYGARLYRIVTGEQGGIQIIAYVWIPNEQYVEGVFLTRNRLWVTTLAGLLVFDLSDPENPSELALAPGFDPYAYGVADCGDQILLTDLDGQVKLYDVTNWANPVLLDVYQDSESSIGFIKQIVGTGGMILVESLIWNGEENHSTCIQLAVAGGSELVEVARRELMGGYEYHLDARDGFALVVGRTHLKGGYGLVMDMSAVDLEIVSGIRLWGQVYSGFLSGGKAIVGTRRTGLHVFDLHSSQGVYDDFFRPAPYFSARKAMEWAKSGQHVGILYREYSEQDEGPSLWNYTLDFYDSDVPLEGPFRTVDLNTTEAGYLSGGEAGFYCK